MKVPNLPDIFTDVQKIQTGGFICTDTQAEEIVVVWNAQIHRILLLIAFNF